LPPGRDSITRSSNKDSMSQPIIAITRDSDGSPSVPDASYAFYSGSIERAGGQAFPVFYSDDFSTIDALLDQADGLLFSGGDDLDPALYGQPWHPKAKPVDPRRQAFELKLLQRAEQRRKPILGICLGCQLLNVHRGGSLIQFLPDVPRPAALEHRKVNGVLLRHEVTLEADSILGQAIGKPALSVNTYHKQSIDRPGQGLRVTGRATDGVVEAIEDAALPLFVGVQWHPERISDEPEHLAIFRLLVERSRR
jgi:putative glutamine amidotransferase